MKYNIFFCSILKTSNTFIELKTFNWLIYTLFAIMYHNAGKSIK